MGLIFNLSDVQARANEMISHSQNYYSQIEAILAQIQAFAIQKELRGRAYDAAKDYFTGVIEPICAGGKYICEELESSASIHLLTINTVSESETYLNEDELDDQLRDIENQINRYEQCKAAYNLYKRSQDSLKESVSSLQLGLSAVTRINASYFLQIRESGEELYRLKAACEKKLRILKSLNRIGNSFESLDGQIERFNSLMSSSMDCYQDGTYNVPQVLLKRCNDYVYDFFEDSFFTDDEIGELLEIYSIKELLGIDEVIKEEDVGNKIFLKEFYRGDYDNATKMNPEILSDATSILMVQHLTRLAERDKINEIEKFTNALLDVVYIQDENGWRGDILKTRNVEGYLEKLTTGSNIIMETNMLMFACPEILTQESRDKIKRSHQYTENLAVYWSVLDAIKSDLQATEINGLDPALSTQYPLEIAGDRIFSLDYNDAGFSFEFEKGIAALTPEVVDGEIVGGYTRVGTEARRQIIATKTASQTGMNDLETEAFLTKKRAEKEALSKKYTWKTIKIMSKFHPVAAAIVTTVDVFAGDDADAGEAGESVYSVIQKKLSKTGTAMESKSEIFTSISLLQLLYDYDKDVKEIDREMLEKIFWRNTRNLGTMGGYSDGDKTYLTYTNIYNINVVENLYRWNEQGMKGLYSNESVYNKDLDKIKKAYGVITDRDKEKIDRESPSEREHRLKKEEQELRAVMPQEQQKYVFGGFMGDGNGLDMDLEEMNQENEAIYNILREKNPRGVLVHSPVERLKIYPEEEEEGKDI